MNLEINNNVNIEELYDGKTWIHGEITKILNTIFLITTKESNCIFIRCY